MLLVQASHDRAVAREVDQYGAPGSAYIVHLVVGQHLVVEAEALDPKRGESPT